MNTTRLSNLEIATLCAEAMGYTDLDPRTSDGYLWAKKDGYWIWYWPLTHPELVMDMVVQFDIQIHRDFVSLWYPDYARTDFPGLRAITTHAFEKRSDIPRAVCLCVADMQLSARAHARKKAHAGDGAA